MLFQPCTFAQVFDQNDLHVSPGNQSHSTNSKISSLVTSWKVEQWDLSPKKLTWQWKITIIDRRYIDWNGWFSFIMLVFQGGIQYVFSHPKKKNDVSKNPEIAFCLFVHHKISQSVFSHKQSHATLLQVPEKETCCWLTWLITFFSTNLTIWN